MRPLKAEVDALSGVLMTPLEDFLTAKEQAEHKDPEGLAQKRMFTKAIEAVDEARGERTSWIVVLRFGTVPSSVIYQSFGPWSTKAQAQAGAESILSAVDATAYAVVPQRSESGWKALLSAADEPPEGSSMWSEVRKDAEAVRNGWRSKKARERDKFLDPV